MPQNAKSGTQTFSNGTYGTCVISECNDGYEVQNNSCVKQQSEEEACGDALGYWEADSSTCTCYDGDELFGSKPAEWNSNTLQCECSDGFEQSDNVCTPVTEAACKELDGSWLEDDGYCEF